MTIDDRLRESGSELRAAARTIDRQPIGTVGQRRHGLVYAAATAAVVLLLIGSAVWLSIGGEIQPAGTEPTVPVTTVPSTITSPATTVPLLSEASRSAVMTLSAAPGVEPVRVPTVLGDFEFTTLQAPLQEDGVGSDATFFADPIAWTPYGPVAIDDGSLWWSADYQTWQTIPGAYGLRLTVAGDDLIVYNGGGAARYAWNGNGWSRQQQLDLPQPIREVVFGPRGAVAVGVSTDTLIYSTDGVSFSEADHSPELDMFVAKEGVPDEDRQFGDCRLTAFADASRIRAVLATDTGFVAFTSAFHPDGLICEPLLWSSPDGNTWELVSPESPFGEISSIDSAIVERKGRFVATGEVGGQGLSEGRSVVWVSDDGLTWEQTNVDFKSAFNLAAGDLGWILTGSTGTDDARRGAMWFSGDALTWDGPYEMPAGLSPAWFPTRLIVGSDTIFGVGTWPGTWDRTPVVGRLRD